MGWVVAANVSGACYPAYADRLTDRLIQPLLLFGEHEYEAEADLLLPARADDVQDGQQLLLRRLCPHFTHLAFGKRFLYRP